jgi:NADH-quinone oxidoreductase subunit M
VITTITIFFPLLAALLMLALPKSAGTSTVRYFALALAAVPLLLSLYIYFRYGTDLAGAAPLRQDLTWIESLGVGYRVGLDGLGFGMFFLTALLTVVAVLASWDIRENLRQYLSFLFVAELGMLGVFAAQDLVLFYVFFEITLIPMYLLVGVWGDENRRAAAIKFFVFTFLGSTTMLAGFLALGIISGPTFSMAELNAGGGLSRGTQIAIAAPILFGLLIKVPAVPLHSWLLDVYVSSPTSTNVLLSGILPKLGTYGLIRIALPLLPEGIEPYLPFIAALGVVNIIYGAFVAFAQPDLKALVAYSSIGTLGFILVGIASGNAVGLNGAVMQQVTHGLYSALLFILVGIVAARTGTRRIADLGGFAAKAPMAASLLVIGALAAMGLPGLAVFVSEFMSIMGGYRAFPVAGVLASLGIILSVMYLSQMLRRTMFGPPRESAEAQEEEPQEQVGDARPREMAAMAPLALLLILLGVVPGVLLSIQRPAVEFVLATIGGS